MISSSRLNETRGPSLARQGWHSQPHGLSLMSIPRNVQQSLASGCGEEVTKLYLLSHHYLCLRTEREWAQHHLRGMMPMLPSHRLAVALDAVCLIGVPSSHRERPRAGAAAPVLEVRLQPCVVAVPASHGLDRVVDRHGCHRPEHLGKERENPRPRVSSRFGAVSGVDVVEESVRGARVDTHCMIHLP